MSVSPPDRRTDQELIAAANAGDCGAFEAIYERYRDWVLRVAWRYNPDRDEAMDAVQETFLYLLRKFPGFKLTSRMTTFLFPVVRNIALTQRRRRGRDESGTADVDVAARVWKGARAVSDAGAPHADSGDDLAVVLGGLPEAQRDVLLMRYVDDMELAEIAAALEVPLGTVKSRLHGALERLRADPGARRYFGD